MVYTDVRFIPGPSDLLPPKLEAPDVAKPPVSKALAALARAEHLEITASMLGGLSHSHYNVSLSRHINGPIVLVCSGSCGILATRIKCGNIPTLPVHPQSCIKVARHTSVAKTLRNWGKKRRSLDKVGLDAYCWSIFFPNHVAAVLAVL